MKRRKPMISTAEPLSDDDFAAESKALAKEYAEIQHIQASRERIRAENKERKKRGEPILSLPKLPSKRRKVGTPTKITQESSESDLESSDNDQEPRSTRRRDKAMDDELIFEGQVILPFNPLYLLAGLPDPNKKALADQVAKQKLVDRLAGRKIPSSPARTPSTARGSSPAMFPPSSPRSASAFGVEPSSTPGKDNTENPVSSEAAGVEACEGDYDDEMEDVVVSWGAVDGVVPVENGEGQGEGEAGYSDDDVLFSAADGSLVKRKSPNSRRANKLDVDDLPSYRPNFPFSDEQAQIGSFPLDDSAKDIAIPASINRFLKAYQQVGAQFLYDHYKDGMGGVLGDDMGLGKTIQVISFLSAIMRKTGTSVDYQRRKKMIRRSSDSMSPKRWPTALVVCPKSLVGNWGYFEYAVWRSDNWSDVRTTFMKGFLDIVLTSYDTARNTIEYLKNLPLSQYRVVIVDEAHRMKEPRALSTLALKKIQCQVCFALTGTLVQNRMDEMWSVLDFVHRGWAGTLKQWREFAVNPIKKGHRHEGSVQEVVTAIKRLGDMTTRILPHFYLRRDKRLIAHELPEKRDMVVFCPLAFKQIDAYQALIDSEDVRFILTRNDPCSCGSGDKRIQCCHQYTSRGERMRDVLLKNLTACKKVANHFGLLYPTFIGEDDPPQTRKTNRHFFKICTGQDYDMKHRNVVEESLNPDNCGKWTLLEQLLTGWRGEPTDNKVLIFSNSVRMLKMIAEFISTSAALSGFDFDILTGDVANEERMEMVDRFQDRKRDHFVFLISTLAGGVGLNLTAANKVVIFDPDWTMDRAFRIGQKRTVDVYRLIGQGTVEELVYERQIHKQQRSRQLNDGTFERRIHQGYDGARTAADQAELFGVQNIFRFDPNGFVSNNLERVRMAEDRFVQDLIEAEYNDSEGENDESDEEGGRRMRDERKARDLQRAHLRAAKKRDGEPSASTFRGRDEDVVDNIFGDAPVSSNRKNNNDILQKLGVTSRIHEQAFVDSPEERAIYEIGVKMLREDPETAKKFKANDLGKLGRTVTRRSKVTEGDIAHDEEPWQKRIKEKVARAERHSETPGAGGGGLGGRKLLAELSD
ncbi:hypothetical protein I316_03149 [Kwoniella heveanensis BCC8398]|uniref:DNA excision repair protein ERCC-6-like 2 n=1 Tax=Kwoniella heveanensis BCC8398 TaxID=1296120 RepID=A0A1B9GVR6_9TREE|nr:hypothetical protein I316_03149 [Kwoniella heveanensis BCC8398]